MLKITPFQKTSGVPSSTKMKNSTEELNAVLSRRKAESVN